ALACFHGRCNVLDWVRLAHGNEQHIVRLPAAPFGGGGDSRTNVRQGGGNLGCSNPVLDHHPSLPTIRVPGNVPARSGHFSTPRRGRRHSSPRRATIATQYVARMPDVSRSAPC